MKAILFLVLCSSLPAFAAPNPYDPNINENQFNLDELPTCPSLGRGAICPVLEVGTLAKALLKADDEGQTFLVWKSYWVNHRPVLYAFTAAVVVKPQNGAPRFRVVYKGTERQDGSAELQERAPTVIAISVDRRKVTVGQTFLKLGSGDTNVRVDQNAPLFAFEL